RHRNRRRDEDDRVRARRLYEAGIKTKEELRDANPDRLARLLGPKTAVNVLDEVGVETDMDEIDADAEAIDENETKQSSIGDFG
ncbi:MAG: helix-hairpin-helix domain-containing protein, partial [Halobacteria archaeon]|nr:helix-hairpin-helix domain-containing protein [Halobacteria archaeon]